jgi:hypothetical protein
MTEPMNESWNSLALRAAMNRIALHLDEMRSAQEADDPTLLIQAARAIEAEATKIAEMTLR